MDKKFSRMSGGADIGIPVKLPRPRQPGSWVQTERQAHEAWARLIGRAPRAAALLHLLVARMGDRNAVVVSQKTLAALLGASRQTVERAVAVLREERWLQVVRLNGPGTVAAYVVNDQVAWGQSRDDLSLSTFSATVIADAADQDEATLERIELRRIPSLFPGERQLPTGSSENSSSQAGIGDLPDLPALTEDEAERVELQERGQQRLVE